MTKLKIVMKIMGAVKSMFYWNWLVYFAIKSCFIPKAEPVVSI